MTAAPDPATAAKAREHAVAGCIDAAARYLASEPGAVQRALARHRPTDDGRCSACGPRTAWPCTVLAIAQHGLDLLVAEDRRS